jgi:(p)ppGpp synthase/HD superfamily hydrolase
MHCVEVARILAELQLDSVTVATGLIHDVIEDTDDHVEDVEREFGKEIAQIVDGSPRSGTCRSSRAGAAGRELPQAAAVDREGRA